MAFKNPWVKEVFLAAKWGKENAVNIDLIEGMSLTIQIHLG